MDIGSITLFPFVSLVLLFDISYRCPNWRIDYNHIPSLAKLNTSRIGIKTLDRKVDGDESGRLATSAPRSAPTRTYHEEPTEEQPGGMDRQRYEGTECHESLIG